MSTSHNSSTSSSSSSSDSLPFHMTSMLHETFNHNATDAKLYEYLLHGSSKEEEESLPELDASTTTTNMSRMTLDSPSSMYSTTLRRQSSRRRSSFSVSAPRVNNNNKNISGRFGWSPSPISNKRSSSESALSPYLVKQPPQVDEECLLLQRQLQQAQQEYKRARQEQEEQERQYKQQLQHVNGKHDCQVQQHRQQQEQLIEKLHERDELLESNQVELDDLQLLLQQERERNALLEKQLLQQQQQQQQAEEFVNVSHETSRLSHDESGESSSVELDAKIDECQRELQELGLDMPLIPTNDDDECSIPREIHTQVPQESSPYISCSIDLAHSLLKMLHDSTLSSQQEDAVWTQLANMSQLLYGNNDGDVGGDKDYHDYQHHNHDIYDDNQNMVPLHVYEELQHYCEALQQERSSLKQEMLECLSSTRTAHALQLQIMVHEIKEEAQRQVNAIVTGQQQQQQQQERGEIDLSRVVGSEQESLEA